MNISKKPNPERIYEVIARILERRHGVKIDYTIQPKNQGGTT